MAEVTLQRKVKSECDFQKKEMYVRSPHQLLPEHIMPLKLHDIVTVIHVIFLSFWQTPTHSSRPSSSVIFCVTSFNFPRYSHSLSPCSHSTLQITYLYHRTYHAVHRVQLTLEQHGFKPCWSTYTQFFTVLYCKCIFCS